MFLCKGEGARYTANILKNRKMKSVSLSARYKPEYTVAVFLSIQVTSRRIYIKKNIY